MSREFLGSDPPPGRGLRLGTHNSELMTDRDVKGEALGKSVDRAKKCATKARKHEEEAKCLRVFMASAFARSAPARLAEASAEAVVVAFDGNCCQVVKRCLYECDQPLIIAVHWPHGVLM